MNPCCCHLLNTLRILRADVCDNLSKGKWWCNSAVSDCSCLWMQLTDLSLTAARSGRCCPSTRSSLADILGRPRFACRHACEKHERSSHTAMIRTQDLVLCILHTATAFFKRFKAQHPSVWHRKAIAQHSTGRHSMQLRRAHLREVAGRHVVLGDRDSEVQVQHRVPPAARHPHRFPGTLRTQGFMLAGIRWLSAYQLAAFLTCSRHLCLRAVL